MNGSPEFIDLQINGHGGVDFLSVKNSDDVRIAARSLFNNGVKGFLPTLITADPNQLFAAAKLIREVQDSPRDGEAEILGFHLEGPFISDVKCGVHPKHYIAKPSIEAMKKYLSIGDVKIVTLAPELPGALDLIKFLVQEGVVASLGHSNASESEAHAGFDAGAKTVTHLYNGMSKIPGLAGVALEREDVVIQIIVDDVHVARADVSHALSRSMDRFILTNDTVTPAGLGDGKYHFGEMDIEVRDGRAVRVDGTLAGGIGTLQQSLEILAELGIPADIARASVTTRPLALIT